MVLNFITKIVLISRREIFLTMAFVCFLSFQLSAQFKSKNVKETSTSKLTIEEIFYDKSSLKYIITSEHISSISGIRHIYLRQALNGLEVYGSESSLHP